MRRMQSAAYALGVVAIVATAQPRSRAASPTRAAPRSAASGRDAIWWGACPSGNEKTNTFTFMITTNAAVTANVP